MKASQPVPSIPTQQARKKEEPGSVAVAVAQTRKRFVCFLDRID